MSSYNDFQVQLIVSVLLAFLAVNYDYQVSSIFLFFAFLSLFFYWSDTFVKYKTEREGGSRVLQIVYAVIAYIIFNIIGAIILHLFGGLTSLTGSSFSVFSDSLFQYFSQNTPALTGNAFISLAIWGVLIPYVETELFFGRMFEFLVDKIKVNIGFNVRTISVISIIGGIFTVFHLTAKGISNNSALLLTFLFAITSLVLVIMFKQTIEAKILHIIANMGALIIGMGLGFTNLAILSIVGLLLLVHLYPIIKQKTQGFIPYA